MIRSSDDNSPIAGAIVKVKNSSEYVISDVDGQYSIEFAQAKATLEFSCLGFATKEIYITDQGVVNVTLDINNEVLGESIVVGAGTQKKISVTGSIASVKGNILKTPSASLTSNLAGKLAGVVSVAHTGEPGKASEFYIRGVGTFGGRATPLVILDGVEISAADLDKIPAEPIESFSILKDASATAIYGARGANGVMIVTTKSGENNSKAKINVSVENSFLMPSKMVDYIDGPTWMEQYNLAMLSRNPEESPRYSRELIELTRSGKSPYLAPNVDWYDVLFKKMTMNQRANVNISGGGSRVTYYMSLQANHDTGMLNSPKVYSFNNNINYWDYIFQNNIGYNVTKTTNIDLRINAQIGRHKGPGYSVNDLFLNCLNANAITFPATYPAEEGDTHIKFGNAWLTKGEGTYINPYAKMLESFMESNYSTLNTTLKIRQDFNFITEGLSATALINFKTWAQTSFTRSMEPFYYLADLSSTEDNLILERIGNSGQEHIQESGISRNNDNTIYFDVRVDYSRVFNKKHYVSGMLMYMQREFRNAVLPNRNQGFSGRFTYDYAHKYLAEINFGYNGTERLARKDRYEFFPAVSLGWVISGENFWKPVEKVIDYFKIRASYGLVGSDETGTGGPHFLYLDSVSLGKGYWFHTGYMGEQSYTGPIVNSYAVEKATWERVKKLDVGVDLRLFDQVDIIFDFFFDQRYNILMKRSSWPAIMGYGNAVPWSNIGRVNNSGFELSVNWRKQFGKDLIFDFRGNFTYNHNKYIYKDEPNYPYVWQKETGHSMNLHKGFIADGLFKDEADIASHATQNFGSPVMPGDIKYRDVNGDGIISSDDQVILSEYGNMPRIQYGFGLNITWKKLDFGIFFNGSAQRTIMTNGIAPFVTDYNYGERNMMTYIYKDHWSVENPDPNAKYPRLAVKKNDVANNMKSSSFWLRKAGFLRLKTLELGYSFPHCRVYANADNLAVFSPFKEWDPELGPYTYPFSRTVNIGVQVSF